MKYLALSLWLLGSCMGFSQDYDPFAYVPPSDPNGKMSSRTVLDPIRLKAFQEPYLDKGTGDDRDLIRITISRSFHAPVMLKWYPGKEGESSQLQVKVLKKGDDGESYSRIGLEKNITISAQQRDLLTRMVESSKATSLPAPCWQGAMLDGSTWIYEFASKGDSICLERKSPILSGIEIENLDKKRLLRETHLTALTMMLWQLADLKGEELY